MNSLFLSSFFWLERVKHLQIFDRIGFNILKHELYRVQKKSLVFETLYIYVFESNIFCKKLFRIIFWQNVDAKHQQSPQIELQKHFSIGWRPIGLFCCKNNAKSKRKSITIFYGKKERYDKFILAFARKSSIKRVVWLSFENIFL